jgi:hypothetical protein
MVSVATIVLDRNPCQPIETMTNPHPSQRANPETTRLLLRIHLHSNARTHTHAHQCLQLHPRMENAIKCGCVYVATQTGDSRGAR